MFVNTIGLVIIIICNEEQFDHLLDPADAELVLLSKNLPLLNNEERIMKL